MTAKEALKLFTYKHLPQHLQDISKPFHDQAYHICSTLQPSAYRTEALWKLWEAKNLVVAAYAQGGGQ